MATSRLTSPTQDLDAELTRHLIKIQDEKLELSRQVAKKNVKIVEKTIESLISAMKNTDKLFGNIYQRIIYTGSYYEGLRVKDPNEFDLNMVLTLPSKFRKEEDFELTMSDDASGFFKFRIKRDPMQIESRKNPDWYDFFSEDEILLRSKVQSWIHSVTTKAMDSPDFKQHCDEEDININRRQSGPAFTYNITTSDGRQIDVDLVPVIRLPADYPIPKEIHQSNRFKELAEVYQEWCLVPKQHSKNIEKSQDFLWRISFPEAEKKLLPSDDHVCVKTLIKLFKLLRDTENWKPIASYYIKTLFLLELDGPARLNDDLTGMLQYLELHRKPEYKAEDWQQQQMGTLFKKMLNKLKFALDDKYLSYYFVRSANLLASMDEDNAKNISNRIAKILKDISANPENVTKIFCL